MSNSTVPLPSVLVVEDDAFIQAILNQTLSEHFSVTIFTDGMEGLNYLQSGNIPDIILSDLNIPGLNGMEFLEQVRNSGFFSSVPFIILSGKEDTDTRIRCLEAGADDYLIKPFNPRELDARLKNILRRMGKI
ncbi:MAG: response regulator transcription factor [Chitinophagaceae bacterium]|nr:response regulator transcription factor [Chitinophagaceae bacterium]